MAAGLSRLAQVAIYVRNLDRAIAFYRDTLGVPFLFQAPPKMAFFACGDMRLLIGEPEAGQPSRNGAMVYFRVESIDAEYQRLTAAGVRFEEPPRMIARLPDREVWLAEFDDGEGNALALMSEPAI